MSMRDYVLNTYRFNLWFVKKAVEDIPEELMAQQPKPGMNHAAWILGHLSMERVFFKNVLKLDLPAPEGWEALFMPGSTPTSDRSNYPSKAELIAAVEASHAAIETAFLKMTDAEWEAPTPNERMRTRFPKVGDVVVGLMTAHSGVHVGQLSAWRRAMGLKSIF